MDRQIVYVGQIPQDTDLLLTNKNTMVALGYLMQAILGTSTLVDGLACTPTAPATLTIDVAGGSIYSLEEIDATAYGSLAADTADQIVKQGIIIGSQNFSCAAPGTVGQSVVYLVEAAYQDTDTGSTVLPYYNSSNPSEAYSGPSNSGISQNTIRQGLCKVQVKTGVAATTGTQVTPAPDAGFTGLFAVTVANGQSSITSGDIVQLSTAPFINPKLTGIIADVQAGSPNFAHDTSGAANTITIALSPVPTLTDGMPIRVKVANTITGATVMNTNGLGNVSIVTPAGAALGTGTLVANGIYEFTYDANGTRWIYDGSGNLATSLGTAAYKAASDNSKSTVASISGSTTASHLAVFADTAGTIKDGGAIVPSNINGLLPTSISGTNTTAAITVSAGVCSDSTQTVQMVGAGYSWAASNGNAINGTDAASSTLANSTPYHLFLCSGTSGTGTFVSASQTPTLPSGYNTYKRRIYSFMTTAAGAPIPATVIEVGGGTYRSIPSSVQTDISTSSLGNTKSLFTLASVPYGTGLRMKVGMRMATSSANYIDVFSPDEPTPSPGDYPNGFDMVDKSGGTESTSIELLTNTSAQIAAIASGTSIPMTGYTKWFEDFRRV